AGLGKAVGALMDVTGAVPLLGHSFGGLVAREAVLAAQEPPASITLMSSGPAALPGERARGVRSFLSRVADATSADDLAARVAQIWHASLKSQAIAGGATAAI